MYQNKLDKNGQCAIRGKEAEDIFERWLISQGREYRRATLEEQIEHIDFLIKNPITNEVVTVDVKAPKSICRGGAINNQILWVEFKNVIGKSGWLYGSNGYIAFHHSFHIPKYNSLYFGSNYSDYFIVVKTDDFAKFCENICNKGIAKSAEDAMYKRYTRRGKKDEISMITMQDLYDWGEYWEIAI